MAQTESGFDSYSPVPTPESFQHVRHTELEDSWKYRRMRYQLWRAAALRRRRRRDDPDKLLATYRDFGPRDINGNYPEYGYCIWRRPPKYTDARYRDRIRYEASDDLRSSMAGVPASAPGRLATCGDFR